MSKQAYDQTFRRRLGTDTSFIINVQTKRERERESERE